MSATSIQEKGFAGLLTLLRARQASFGVGSVITFAFNGIAFVLYALGTILVARALGPRESGHLVWFITGTTTLAVFADVIGVYYSNAYLIARGHEGFDLAAIRGTVLAYGTVLGLLVAGLCVWPPIFRITSFFGFEDSLGRLLVALNVLGLVLVTQVRGLFWGGGSFLLLGLLTLIRSGGYAVLAITLVYGWGWHLGSRVALAQVIANWTCVLGALAFFAVRGIRRPDLGYLKSCLRVGWRGAGVYFTSFLHLRLDQYLVNTMLGATALGLYGVVSSLGETIVQGPTMLGSVLFSVVAADRDRARAAQATLKRMKITMLLVAVLTLPLAVFAPAIIRLAFGESFLPSARLLLFFLPGTVFLSGLVLINHHLAALGYPLFQLQAALAALATNIAANLLLLPRIGVVGAPISNSLSCAVWLVIIGGYLVRKTRAHASRQSASAASGG